MLGLWNIDSLILPHCSVMDMQIQVETGYGRARWCQCHTSWQSLIVRMVGRPNSCQENGERHTEGWQGQCCRAKLSYATACLCNQAQGWGNLMDLCTFVVSQLLWIQLGFDKIWRNWDTWGHGISGATSKVCSTAAVEFLGLETAFRILYDLHSLMIHDNAKSSG